MSRSYQSLGFFLPVQVKAGFADGRFRSGDYGRYEDSGEWRPVEVIVAELKAQCVVVEAPSSPALASVVPAPVATDAAGADSGCADNGAKEERKGIVAFIKEVVARF